MILTDIPPLSFSKVALHIVGLLSKTNEQNQYIITTQDVFLKYTIDVPYPNHAVTTVANALIRRLICVFRKTLSNTHRSEKYFLRKPMTRVTKQFKIQL